MTDTVSGRDPAGQALVSDHAAVGVDGPSGFDPSRRLKRYWPIPMSKDNEGVFCDLASEGAATGLLALMTGISEEHWCASWMSGLEWDLWLARENGPRGYGMLEITQRQCDLLRLLSDESDGWWHWADDGPRFAPLENWREYAIAMEARQGRDAKQGSVEDDSAAIAQSKDRDHD